MAWNESTNRSFYASLCDGEGVYRSKRKGFIEHGPLTLISLKPFRCADCRHRIFRSSVTLGVLKRVLEAKPRRYSYFSRPSSDNEYFEARASVVYSRPNLGMGLTFRDVKPYFLPVLLRPSRDYQFHLCV